MRHRDFCYWLKGFYEIQNPKDGLSKEQCEEIKKHLDLCFNFESIDPELLVWKSGYYVHKDCDRPIWNANDLKYYPVASC
jgi:hypothetical protein